MDGKVLGKLKNVKFGIHSDRENIIGLSFTLIGESACNTGIYFNMESDKDITDGMREIYKLLKDAKVKTIPELENIPMEYTFKDSLLVNYRVLVEVI